MLRLDLRQKVLNAKEAALAFGRLPQVSQGGEVGCDPLVAGTLRILTQIRRAASHCQFFFALPMHGLEQLYSRFGDSASLVGPVYKREKETSAELDGYSASTAATPNSAARQPSPLNRDAGPSDVMSSWRPYDVQTLCQ